MGNGIKPVAQTYIEVSNVKHKTVNAFLDYSNEVFTYLKNAYTADNMKPLSLKDFEQLINEYSNAKGGKQNDKCLLKGLFKNGYNGENCVKPVPYLFFDIDVKDNEKKKENTHLLHPETNQVIFNELQKIAVICWRSNSGNGIAGVFYVPQLTNYLNDKKDLHKTAGEAITKHIAKYLHKVTGIDPVTFDQAQSKFRQVRFLAEQKRSRKLNPRPFEYSYKTETKTKEYTPGVTVFKPSNYRNPYGTITAQFDSDNDILPLMQNNGFCIVSDTGHKVRVKHINSESTTTGEVDKDQNIYFNYSTTLGGETSFTPSKIIYTFQYNGDWGNFYKYLRGLGYKEKTKTQAEIKSVSKGLKQELKNIKDNSKAGLIIFKYCYDLQTLTNAQKKLFIKENCPRDALKEYFVAYLNLTEQKIKFDKRLTIENYVSDVLPAVLNYTDQHGKVILAAETGKGKSTAFLKDFFTYRPEARILILEPLTVIVDQSKKEYGDQGIFLTGQSDPGEHAAAIGENLVVATYEQGIELFKKKFSFDYVIVDEVHQLLTAHSYKTSTISELTPFLEQNKVIGLTGTPNQIFKKLGYKIVNVAQPYPKKTKVEIRYSNKRPFDLAVNHLQNAKGKVMIRLNEIKTIKSLVKWLIDTGLYKENEILVFYSTNEIKDSKAFKQLAHQRQFVDKIKLILTTSIIDEGVSIDQAGFTDIVFIETNYTPRPEAVKQLFARFRNEDPNRKNYLYLRKTDDQTPTRLNPDWLFDNNLKTLQNEAGEIDVFSTYKTLFSNEEYFYKGNTVNPFFLAYSVTTTYFKGYNAKQFVEYLETNYNLRFTVNSTFDPGPVTRIEDKEFKKLLKQQIANVWTSAKDEVLQLLALNTQDKEIRKALTVRQQRFEPQTEKVALNNIKDFETLYKRSEKLRQLGADDPDTILIKDDTLASNDYYNKQTLLLKIQPTIMNPQNAADMNQARRFILFAQWCKNKETFTYKQMYQKLRSLRIVNLKAYNEKMLFEVLKWFELNAKRNRKTNIIKVDKLG